jgi:hypothetical protein
MISRLRAFVLVCTLATCAWSVSSHAQSAGKPGLAYPDSAAGLQRCLTDVLAASKAGDSTEVAALLKDMEIPNFAKWFNKSYGKQVGNDSAELYRMNVDSNEVKLAAVFMQFTDQKGEVIVRKVNDAPEPGTLEPAMLKASKIPTEIYFAAWRSEAEAPASTDVSIGYFVFIDGRFRWDTAINYPARRASSKSGAVKSDRH